jgi:hypothetical protein
MPLMLCVGSEVLKTNHGEEGSEICGNVGERMPLWTDVIIMTLLSSLPFPLGPSSPRHEIILQSCLEQRDSFYI